jgi:cbb3-type cytochrome oxidase subunit 1
MIFGIWMGITESLNFTNTHAHINLVGFVTFVLFGIVYRLWPALKEGRLAMAHFALAVLATPIFLIGKAMVDSGIAPNLPIVVGALGVAAAMLVFIANLATLGRRVPAAGYPAPAE